MSSSFLRCCAAALLAGGTATAGAADYYFTPQVDGGVEYYSNLDLVPDEAVALLKQDVVGYVFNAAGVAGVRTERGFTEVRPRLQFQEYPDRDDLQSLNGYLDLRSQYNSLRGVADLNGRFRRVDRSRAELVDAGYDDFNPENPVVDSAGRLSVFEETVTDWQLRGTYRRSISERLGWGLSGLYQDSSFDSAGPTTSGTDYGSWEVGSFLSWDFSQRTRVDTGLYYSDYEADNGSNLTTGYGLSVDIKHDFSETMSATLQLDAERTEVETPSAPLEKSNSVGASVGVVRTGQTSQWRLEAGRTFSPSTYGYRSTVDQVRIQMRRNLSPRLRLNTALRAFSQESQGRSSRNGNNREYLRADLELRWEVSRTWFLTGGYSYLWQEYEGNSSAGKGNIVVLRFGYAALPPQRR